ncbi:MAG: hypothetical protein K2K63_12660 [Acetatifactor sp.]|nr:hypothetical protein [Acetatifactor sp.]
MKEKRLLKVLGEIDEQYVEEAAPAVKKAGGEKSKVVYIRWGVTAACLCLLCVSVIAVSGRFSNQLPPDIGWNDLPGGEQTALPDMGQTVPADSNQAVGEQELFVPINSLLADGSGGIINEALFIAKVPINGQYTGVYEKIQSVESTVLSENKGRGISGTEEWYYVSGHTDMQYLIRSDNEEYSLWKFSCFDSGEYPYSDVLELVYLIDSADIISEIRVNPPKMDNTNEGMTIQKKIGTHSITNREQINVIYEVLSSMTCYGSGHWDMIDNGSTDVPADAELPSHQAVWLGRYLSVVTDYGNEIDGLKYTAVSDMFYEFSGIAYNRLTEEQAAKIWEIIGITEEGEEITGSRGAETNEIHRQEVPSAPADEIFRIQATNTDAGLEYVTELQDRVSGAMINQELPFVIASSVYENPYRLHVVVTSDSEEDLQKLLDLDSLGGVLEIEYTASDNFVK